MSVTEAAQSSLPHWDMTPLFPSLSSPEFEAAYQKVIDDVGALREIFDTHDIRKQERAELSGDTVSIFETIVARLNAMYEEQRTLVSYIHSFVTTDSRNDLAQGRLSELQMRTIDMQKMQTRFNAWIGSLDVEALIERSIVASNHAFMLRKTAVAARHQMSEGEEDLAASLNLTGGSAWAKLHGNVTSRLMVEVPYPNGETRKLPMSAVRGLAEDADEAVRKAAYDAELKAWETVAVPLAAAMNGIKGHMNVVNERRGWQDALEPELFANNVDRTTLDAMQLACRESFPDFRRYLQAKATLLGKPKLAWWNMFAPSGGSSRVWEYPAATEFVLKQFANYSDKMAGLADRSFRENWVDAEPRNGKRDGAFCMGVRAGESRILMNYKSSFGSVHTLAHELGHAYHNLNLAQRTPLQRSTPMPLAETASIFCETIITNAALEQLSGDEQLDILEGDLRGACQVVVDIYSRFLFEQRVFERRRKRELSVDEFNTLMVDAQRETYGDGLDADTYHPYMWAVKGHYYSTGRSFYNWPYTFGMLFGLGLYARYRQDADTFRSSYDELLSSTGLADAASLAQRFDIDIRSVEFWRASLDVIREHIATFEQLVQSRA